MHEQIKTCPKHPGARGHLEPVKRKYKGNVYEYYRFVHAYKRGEKPKKCYLPKSFFESNAATPNFQKRLESSITESGQIITQLLSRIKTLPPGAYSFARTVVRLVEFYQLTLMLMRSIEKLRTRFYDENSQFASLVSEIYAIPEVISYLEKRITQILTECPEVARIIADPTAMSNPDEIKKLIPEFSQKVTDIAKEIKHTQEIFIVLAELYKGEVHMPRKILRKLMRKYGRDEVMPRRISRILSSLVPEKHLKHLQYNWKQQRENIILELFLDGHLTAFPVSPKHLSKIIGNNNNTMSKDISTDGLKREIEQFVERRRVVIEDPNLPDKFKEYVKTESPIEKICRISYEIIQEYNSQHSRDPTLEEIAHELDKRGAIP